MVFRESAFCETVEVGENNILYNNRDNTLYCTLRHPRRCGVMIICIYGVLLDDFMLSCVVKLLN